MQKQIHVLNKKEDSKKDKNNNKEDKNNNNVVNNKKLKNTNKNNLPKTNISNSTMLLAITSLAGFLYSKKKNKQTIKYEYISMKIPKYL